MKLVERVVFVEPHAAPSLLRSISARISSTRQVGSSRLAVPKDGGLHRRALRIVVSHAAVPFVVFLVLKPSVQIFSRTSARTTLFLPKRSAGITPLQTYWRTVPSVRPVVSATSRNS